MQIVSAPGRQVIPACAGTAVDIETSGSDRGLARPTLENLGTGGTKPSNYLVDGGFAKNLVDGGFAKHEDIEWAHASGIKLWCPPAKNKHGSEPYAPHRGPRAGGDGPGIADWRQRMASEPGKTMYKERSKAECVNAWGRRMSAACPPHGAGASARARPEQSPLRAAVVCTRP